MPHKFTEILANILLILLAILVPIFAILISVLAKAIDAGRRRIEQNINDIFRDIEEIRKRSTRRPETVIDELQKAIRKYSWERRWAQLQQFFLSTRAAVYYPGLCFLASLGLLISPLARPITEALSRHDLWLIVASSCLAVLGIGMLCGVLETVKTFAAIYEAPIEPDAATLQIRFRNGASVIVWTAESTQQCDLILRNNSDYLAEKVLVTVLFPPQFEVTKTVGKARLVSQPEGLSAHVGYTAVFWDREESHGHVNNPLDSVELRVPTQKREYVLPVRINAARVRTTKSELKVIVD